MKKKGTVSLHFVIAFLFLNPSYLRAQQSDVSALVEKSFVFEKESQFDSALFYNQRAIGEAEQDQKAQLYNMRGSFSIGMGDYTEAIASFKEAFYLNKQNNDSLGQAYIYNNIGSALLENQMLEEAIPYYEKTLDLLNQIHDQQPLDTSTIRHKIAVYENIAYFYSKRKKISRHQKNQDMIQAEWYLKEAEDLINSYEIQGEKNYYYYYSAIVYFYLESSLFETYLDKVEFATLSKEEEATLLMLMGDRSEDSSTNFYLEADSLADEKSQSLEFDLANRLRKANDIDSTLKKKYSQIYDRIFQIRFDKKSELRELDESIREFLKINKIIEPDDKRFSKPSLEKTDVYIFIGLLLVSISVILVSFKKDSPLDKLILSISLILIVYGIFMVLTNFSFYGTDLVYEFDSEGSFKTNDYGLAFIGTGLAVLLYYWKTKQKSALQGAPANPNPSPPPIPPQEPNINPGDGV